VVMKGESIPANTAWIGAPAEPYVPATGAHAHVTEAGLAKAA